MNSRRTGRLHPPRWCVQGLIALGALACGGDDSTEAPGDERSDAGSSETSTHHDATTRGPDSSIGEGSSESSAPADTGAPDLSTEDVATTPDGTAADVLTTLDAPGTDVMR